MTATKISNLVSTSVVSNSDLLAVVRGSANVYTTNNISVNTFANSIVSMLPYANSSSRGVVKTGNNFAVNATGFINMSITGPYANDSLASAGGVANGQLYYDSTGTIKIRLI